MTEDRDKWRKYVHGADRGRLVKNSGVVGCVVDLNARSGPDEATPLHLACRYNSGSATQFVLSKLLPISAKDAVNTKDVKGRTPLHYATRRGHDMVIKVRR